MLTSSSSILLINTAIRASVAMEFSIEWTPPLDVEFVVDDFSWNPSHYMIFSAISSGNVHASSSVILIKSRLMDSGRFFGV